MPSERHHPAPSPDDPEPKAISGARRNRGYFTGRADFHAFGSRYLRPSTAEPDMQISRIRLSDKTSRLHPRHVVPKPFMPWLLAITRNRLADGGRKWARRAANEVLVDEVPVTFADDRTNSEQERQFDPEGLRKAMRDLPPRQREAVEMLKLREMSLKEAAAESGMSVGSLKVAVHRGIAALRKALVKDQ